jgi:glycosyltransferase involved in cell wall biosynthesis
MHILIVEDALREKSGHWYEYCREISHELRSRGHQVTLLIHKAAIPEIVDELEANPYFPYSAWLDGASGPGRIRTLYRILRDNFEYYRLLGDAFMAAPTVDLVLAPSLTIRCFIAWLLVCFRSRGSWFSKAILMVRTNVAVYCPVTGTYNLPMLAKFSGFVLRRFKRFTKAGLVVFGSDSKRLSEQYSILSRQTFSVLPHPRLISPQDTGGTASGFRITFTSLGQPRHEKGSDLIIKAFSRLLTERPSSAFRLVFQNNFPVTDVEGLPVVVPESWKTDRRVLLIDRSLSTAEYTTHLFESDVVLLPYRRSQYFARLSGIAIETFQAGKCCVCVSDTWVEDCMMEYGSGLSIKNESVDDLYQALLILLDKGTPCFDPSRAAAAQAYHSPRMFVDQLLKSSQPNDKT